jgi:beta-lactamase class A
VGIAPGGDADAGVSPGGDAGADAGDAVIPGTAAGQELTWLLGLLNGPPAAIAEAEVAPHFSPTFLQQVPASQLVELLQSWVASDAPVQLRQIESSSAGSAVPVGIPAPASVVAIVETVRHLFFRITLTASMGGAEPQIVGLLLAPAPETDPALRDPAVLVARVGQVAPEARLFIGNVTGTDCVEVQGLGADSPMPLGSLFKIYVLGALAADVASGRTAWTDPVTIQDSSKSLPSGVLQDQPDGSMFSVAEVAGDMISISDNTAADHLIRLVGRERVEAYLPSMGHSNPALDIPFLTTREMFQLKLGPADDRAAFLAANTAQRRQLLDGDYDLRPLPDLAAAAAWVSPIAVDTLEWFASPADLCRAFASLEKLAAGPTGDTVSTILAMNPGAPLDRQVFSYVGYKGGSEPGVLTLAWLLRRAVDGQWVVATVGFADPVNPIDETLGTYYAIATAQMAGR